MGDLPILEFAHDPTFVPWELHFYRYNLLMNTLQVFFYYRSLKFIFIRRKYKTITICYSSLYILLIIIFDFSREPRELTVLPLYAPDSS